MKKLITKMLILGALLLSSSLALPLEHERQDGNPLPCPPAPCIPPSQ